MLIWFGVNRYELKKITRKVIYLAIKKPHEAAYLLKTIVLLFAFFVLVDDKFNVTFDLCFLGFG